MTHEELERDRRAFMEGRMTADAYWWSFRAYWSQFKKGGQQ